MLEQYNYNEEESGRTMTLLKAIEQIEKLECELEKVEHKYARALWWLNEIVNNHRHTPISTAEMAIKELKENDTKDETKEL